MTLADQIESDATLVFTSTSDFAESVTYHPHQDFGEAEPTDRSINAIVIRDQIATLSEDQASVAPVFRVYVANDSTDGISSSELNLGGDQITLPPRDGKSAERRSITQLLQQDPGMLVLECR